MFKNWFNNLRKTTEPMTSEDYLKGSAFSSLRDPERDVEFIEKHKEQDIKSLKRLIARAVTERKTCTIEDFNSQLNVVLEANAALVHQRILGINENSEITKILSAKYYEEIARLRFLVHENIDVTPEVAEAIYQNYVKED